MAKGNRNGGVKPDETTGATTVANPDLKNGVDGATKIVDGPTDQVINGEGAEGEAAKKEVADAEAKAAEENAAKEAEAIKAKEAAEAAEKTEKDKKSAKKPGEFKVGDRVLIRHEGLAGTVKGPAKTKGQLLVAADDAEAGNYSCKPEQIEHL